MSANKSSVRSKINKFFEQGVSSSKKGTKVSRDIEDPEDLYSHTKQFFKKNQVEEEYVDQVEIGERKIKGEIGLNDLDQLVYGGKKVTRKDLDNSDESMSDEQIGEDEDEEIDSELYGGEDGEESNDIDEGSEGESSNEIMDDSNDEEDQIGLDEEEDDDLDVAKELAKQTKRLKTMKTGGSNMNEDQDEDLDLALKQLKQEEKEESKFISKRVSSDLQKAKSVKTQKKIYDQYLHQRILMQKLLQNANKLPSKNALDLFVQSSKTTEMNLQACKRNIKKQLKDQVRLQKQLFMISETSIKLKTIDEQSEDTKCQEIYKILDHNFSQILPFVEETVDRWNSRTMMIKSLSGNSQKSKAFGKTILEQVNSILNEEESLQKLLEKAHLKRDSYKVLGRNADDITNERDENIFNDFDFYQMLLKDFLAQNDNNEDGEENGTGGGGEDDIYLDGADLGLTQKYLERKKKLLMGQEKIKKEVDRKASKNRKIRYVVHEKIVNFMAPLDNLSNMYEGKDSILKSLFGQQELNNNGQSADANGKKKSSKKQKLEDDDGVRLF